MKRILVVEDEPVTRHLLENVLESAGYEVRPVQDGLEALEALRAEMFDLMLTDVWMPRMGGLELLAAMRAEQRGPRAIVMTSDGTPETVLRAVREQAYQYVSKPVEPTRLLELIEGALHSTPLGPVEVISAQPAWVELLIPCDLGMANRIEEIMSKLETDLPTNVREDVGYVFSEMLRNAVEWGGRLDPNRKVRVACVRTKRMVLYRIADPGPGFKMEDLSHAAVHYEEENVAESARVRQEKGLRPGGFGILVSRAMVDELVYNEKHNEVMFVKYLK